MYYNCCGSTTATYRHVFKTWWGGGGEFSNSVMGGDKNFPTVSWGGGQFFSRVLARGVAFWGAY